MSKSKLKCPSINALSAPLVDALVRDAQSLRLGVETLENGCTVVDAGIDVPGGLEAGRRIAEICLGGLGRVQLNAGSPFPDWPWQIDVTTAQPVLACLGSQYAGWSLSAKFDNGKTFHALGSGPGRALAVKEPLFEELSYRDNVGDAAGRTCLVLEADRVPPTALVEKISSNCGVEPDAVTLILTPTSSLAGGVQIAARVLEVALHKAHELGFALEHIIDGAGCTPVPPPAPEMLAAMGRTNDTILFGGRVHLFVSGEDQAAKELAENLPSAASKDFGRPFAEVFADYDHDFFKIDPMLFSPARVAVTSLSSGRTYTAGNLDAALIQRSFS